MSGAKLCYATDPVLGTVFSTSFSQQDVGAMMELWAFSKTGRVVQKISLTKERVCKRIKKPTKFVKPKLDTVIESQ